MDLSTIKKETLKRMITGIIRQILFAVGALLATHLGLTSEQTAEFTSLEVAGFLASLVLMAAPILLQWAKIRFDIRLTHAAHQSDPDVPLSVIKSEVLNNESKVLPL